MAAHAAGTAPDAAQPGRPKRARRGFWGCAVVAGVGGIICAAVCGLAGSSKSGVTTCAGVDTASIAAVPAETHHANLLAASYKLLCLAF